jgi:hypothetical protein
MGAGVFTFKWPTILTHRNSQLFLVGAAINIGWNVAFPNVFSPLGWLTAGACLSAAWYENLLAGLPTADQVREATLEARNMHAILRQIADAAEENGGSLEGTFEINVERVEPPTRH